MTRILRVQVQKAEMLDPTEGTGMEDRSAGPYIEYRQRRQRCWAQSCTCGEMANFMIMLCRQGLNPIYSTRAEKPCLVNNGNLSD